MKKHHRWMMVGSLLALLTSQVVSAKTSEHSLVIERQPVNITGKKVEKITINGTIPGPTLRFTEGENIVINVTNKLDEDTSIHWHGLLVPGAMDGVPGLNGFPGIKPGETFSYRFKIRQTGTYWYHSHSKGQEQDGEYGSIVIKPRGQDPVKADRDYVVLLSDFTNEESSRVMANLKMSSEYYQFDRLTIGDFFSKVKNEGLAKAWEGVKMWGKMRMLPTDLADVTGYTFLTNGKTPEQNWTGIFKPGERVRLRFINASAMSFFDVRIPGLKMSVVGSDGQNVEPVKVDEFRFGVAEIYDVIVTPKQNRAYTIVAEPIDRTGFALATLASREGLKGDMPIQRERALLTMQDMALMPGMEHDMSSMSGMDHSKMGHDMPEMDDSTMNHDMSGMTDMRPLGSALGVQSGWANTGAPEGTKTLDYADLRYLGIQKDQRPAMREIVVRLGGNMERYIWTMNGKKFADATPINLRYGERVKVRFINETMMAHPMHLHGMFFQLDNGQPIAKLPNKNMVIVPPGDEYSVLLTADEVGEWAFHCHLLYHMMAGMMSTVVVAKLELDAVPDSAKPSFSNKTKGGHQYVH